MYAIVEIAGQQFKVAKDQKVFVHRLEEKEGSKISFDKVLLLDDGKVTIGAPVIENAVVTAKVLGHLKGDNVIVFKKKNGHRQFLSEIQIEGISVKAPAKKAAAKTEETKTEKPAAKKPAAKKTTAKETKAPVKAAPKKEATKKEATKAAPKAAAKKPAAKKEDSPKK